jgi:hypothetical protein
MTHNELIEYGCEFCKREDRHGDTLSGYWLDGVFLGKTARDATEAIKG